ncbi:MAG: hypothetical protein ACKVP2_02075 [Burkholderiales bacterium]
MMRLFAICFLACGVLPTHAAAHAISPAECTEGGDFIRNAALARDAGITREFFVDKLIEDFIVIRAFPPDLRWFVQDEFDEIFLSERVYKVFDEPMEAEEHEAAFVKDCLQVTYTAQGEGI